MTNTLPRIDSHVTAADGRMTREWYKSLTATNDTVNGIVSGQTIYPDTGSVNAMAIKSGITKLVRTTTRYIAPGHTNTSTAVTLNDSGLGAFPVKFPDGSLPAIGQIVAGVTLQVIYDGVFWEIQNIQTANQSIPGNLAIGGTLQVTGSSTLATANLSGGSGSLTIGGAITRFESSEQAIQNVSSLITVAHGGPRVPDLYWWVLRAKSAVHGFAVGDEVMIGTMDVGDTNRAYHWYANATNVCFQFITPGGYPDLRDSSYSIFQCAVTDWVYVARAIWL